MGARKGYKQTPEHRLKVSMALRGKMPKFIPNNKGRIFTEEHKKKLSDKRRGIKLSVEQRKKISMSMKAFVASGRHHLWKGGICPVNMAIRKGLEYKLWRESVFKRDNWTCVWCGRTKCQLNADHIKPFALFPELRLALDNGRTLCEKCHKTTDSYGWKHWNKRQKSVVRGLEK